MSDFEKGYILNGEEVREKSEGMAAYMSRVFAWMFGGLMLTGLTGYAVSASFALQQLVFGNRLVLFGLIMMPFLLIGAINRAVTHSSAAAAKLWFMVFSVVYGLSFSVLFLAYDLGDMVTAFMLTGGLFGVLSLVGFVTKKDLTAFGTLLRTGLLVGIAAILVNLFLGNGMIEMVTTIGLLVIFMGLVVYDTKRIKEYFYQAAGDQELVHKAAVLGALVLYLDFLNIFIRVLRLVGRSRD